MIDDFFQRIELPPNMLICEEKTLNLRWLKKGKERILQQFVVIKYSDHYEEEWRDIEVTEDEA